MTDIVSFSSIGQDGIRLSSEPFETDAFDVRGLFSIDHDGNTACNEVAFGLVGLCHSVDGVPVNYLLLRIKRSGTVTLEKVRGTSITVLASGYCQIANNTQYWARMTYLGGQVHAYICTTQDWGVPVLSYWWSDSDYPCPVANGKSGTGNCGIFARIDALKFTSRAIDAFSTVVPVASLGDFNSFPDAGRVKIGADLIEYSGKSGDETPEVTVNTTSDTGEQYTTNGAYVLKSGDGRGIVKLICSGESDYTGYALWFESGREKEAAWQIASCVGAVVLNLSCLPSGHENTNNIVPGDPVRHEFSVEDVPDSYFSTNDVLARIVPCLNGGTRSGSACGHGQADCLLDEQDTVICHDFECYNYDEDNNTEQLLQRECWLAGVDTEFVGVSGSLTLVEDIKSSVKNGTNPNIDIFTAQSLESGQAILVGFRYSGGSSAFQAGIERVGSDYYAVLRDGDNTLISRHKFTQAPEGEFAMRVTSCIRVTGDAGTFISVYLNRMVHTFYSERHPFVDVNYGTFLVATGGSVLVDYRIPEFSDWREGVYVDTNADAQAALSKVIADRFIKFISRSGMRLKFSAFENYGSSIGTYSGQVIDDQFSQEDADVYTYLHIDAESRQEVLNADLIALEGFLVRNMQASYLTDYAARTVGKMQLRASREMIDQRSITIPADLRLENEDKIAVGYTSDGSTLTLPSQYEVINDLTFAFGPAMLDLKAGVRKHINDGDTISEEEVEIVGLGFAQPANSFYLATL